MNIRMAQLHRLMRSRFEASVLTLVTEETCSLKSSELSVVLRSNFELMYEKFNPAMSKARNANDQTVVLDMRRT